jgi:transposase
MRKRYTTAFKIQVVLELLKEEKTVNQLAIKHGVHPTQLRDWKKQVLDGLPNLFEQSPEAVRQAAAEDREREELFAQIGRLTTQLAWLTHRPTPPAAGTWAKKIWPRTSREMSVSPWLTGSAANCP